MNEQAANPATLNSEMSAPFVLELRDIHLPEPISWWPIAPGWWMVIASLIFITLVLLFIKRIYVNKQLNRDIKSELDIIKQQFQSSPNKSQLAKSLSILLRRACMTYYPKTSIAGLTGNDWLNYLDNTNSGKRTDKKFQSDIGNILLSAPYLADDGQMNFDANTLIDLCESWLLSSHKQTSGAQSS